MNSDTARIIPASGRQQDVQNELIGPAGWIARRPVWADVLVFVFIAAGLYGLFTIIGDMAGPRRAAIRINLAPWSLPKYVAFSVFRGFAAYSISLVFTLIYGYIAAKNRRAERFMIPLLDVLQSIPVLGFMPALMLAMVALFPQSNLGLEAVSILLIFTGQVWNMTFSFYHSLKSIPQELVETARVYRFGWFRRFTRVELPFAAIPLAWNSMVGMAGGWFFLTICESFRLGGHDFRLPGIGSYVTEAIAENNIPAMIHGIIAMIVTILVIDRLFWRPIITWAQKFKFEQTAPTEHPRSMVLDLLRASRMSDLFSMIQHQTARLAATVRHRGGRYRGGQSVQARSSPARLAAVLTKLLAWAGALAAIAMGLWGTALLMRSVAGVEPDQWIRIGTGAGLSLIRVAAALVVASLWAVPVGILIGVRPRLCTRLQPIIQVLASFPAPMLYPLALIAMRACGVPLEYGAIVLLMLGTQWYILFNAIAGAMGIPQELKEACRVYKVTGPRIWRRLYLPAVLSALVTGWIAAAGGAWNATIVAEYVTVGEKVFSANGLGAMISTSARHGEFGVLAASVMVMALVVVVINRTVWRRIFNVASERFSLSQ